MKGLSQGQLKKDLPFANNHAIMQDNYMHKRTVILKTNLTKSSKGLDFVWQKKEKGKVFKT